MTNLAWPPYCRWRAYTCTRQRRFPWDPFSVGHGCPLHIHGSVLYPLCKLALLTWLNLWMSSYRNIFTAIQRDTFLLTQYTGTFVGIRLYHMSWATITATGSDRSEVRDSRQDDVSGLADVIVSIHSICCQSTQIYSTRCWGISGMVSSCEHKSSWASLLDGRLPKRWTPIEQGRSKKTLFPHISNLSSNSPKPCSWPSIWCNSLSRINVMHHCKMPLTSVYTHQTIDVIIKFLLMKAVPAPSNSHNLIVSRRPIIDMRGPSIRLSSCLLFIEDSVTLISVKPRPESVWVGQQQWNYRLAIYCKLQITEDYFIYKWFECPMIPLVLVIKKKKLQCVPLENFNQSKCGKQKPGYTMLSYLDNNASS